LGERTDQWSATTDADVNLVKGFGRGGETAKRWGGRDRGVCERSRRLEGKRRKRDDVIQEKDQGCHNQEPVPKEGCANGAEKFFDGAGGV